MRNILDQYEAPENRLTHALGSCLERDRQLLRAFIQWATGRKELPPGRLEVLEQQVPGTPLGIEDEDESTGLPDLWIHNGAQWSLVVESKVAASVSAAQLRRHANTARRNGFVDIAVLVLAPAVPGHRVPDVVYRTWPEVYCWLRRQARRSEWAACMTEYMEIAEARMTADGYLGDHLLTEFDGIPFGLDHPYTYGEAKRVLRLALAELRKRPDLRKLGMDPARAGHSAITGRDGTAVWDFLWLQEAEGKPNFTSCPHLTLGIETQRANVIVTLPDAVPARMRNNLTGLGVDGFTKLVGDVEPHISKAVRQVKKACPFMIVVQRRYPSRRSAPIVDARVEFDLRTAVGRSASAVKRQPQWVRAVFDALSAKRSNLQVAIGAILPYGDSHMHSREILNVIAGVWVGCKPWLATILR